MKTKPFNADWIGTRFELEQELKEQARQGYGWLSVNHFGAVCLNSNKVLFGDIDCVVDPGADRLNQIVVDQKDAKMFIDRAAEKYNLAFRVYQTYAGIRLIELTKKHTPVADETVNLLKELGCDRAYITLTTRTNVFRARLTPKPWRAEPMAVRFQNQENDITEYLRGTLENPGPRWQIAKYLRTVGNAPEMLEPEIDFIVQLHDDYCHTNDDRPLA